jgi:excisionase family DNA binding protein
MNVYDLDDLVKVLKMNKQTLRIYIREGKLKASKVGRKYIVTEENLKDFLEVMQIDHKKEND